jgi:hypothetical protein
MLGFTVPSHHWIFVVFPMLIRQGTGAAPKWKALERSSRTQGQMVTHIPPSAAESDAAAPHQDDGSEPASERRGGMTVALALPSVPAARAATISSSPEVQVSALLDQLDAREEAELPDAVVDLSDVRMTNAGTIAVPERGEYVLTDWSRQQLSSLVGVRWTRWFGAISGDERAVELNRRFARSSERVRIRTARGPSADGNLRAFVSPTFSAISLAAVVRSVVRSADVTRVHRVAVSDRSSTIALGVGEPYRVGGPGEIGDVWGAILVRDSGVGYASLLARTELVRLACRNGLHVALPAALLVHRRHWRVSMSEIDAQIAAGAARLPEALRAGGELFAHSVGEEVVHVESEVRQVLREARLPARLAPTVMHAYEREPHPSRWGVLQAMTLAAQEQSPEVRFEMEVAAGSYVAAMPWDSVSPSA